MTRKEPGFLVPHVSLALLSHPSPPLFAYMKLSPRLVPWIALELSDSEGLLPREWRLTFHSSHYLRPPFWPHLCFSLLLSGLVFILSSPLVHHLKSFFTFGYKCLLEDLVWEDYEWENTAIAKSVCDSVSGVDSFWVNPEPRTYVTCKTTWFDEGVQPFLGTLIYTLFPERISCLLTTIYNIISNQMVHFIGYNLNHLEFWEMVNKNCVNVLMFNTC